MKRFPPATRRQSARSFANDALCGGRGLSSGRAKSHSMSQRRTTTLGRGFVFVGARRVNWYANVSMRTFGNSFSTASATSFAKRRYGPDGAPPSSSIIALHLSHVQ